MGALAAALVAEMVVEVKEVAVVVATMVALGMMAVMAVVVATMVALGVVAVVVAVMAVVVAVLAVKVVWVAALGDTVACQSLHRTTLSIEQHRFPPIQYLLRLGALSSRLGSCEW